ncbi:MAG TPA: PTS sugar transporter subunit IIA [Candidatus Binatia bacterium]
MRLSTILDPSCIVLDVAGGAKKDVLSRIAAPIVARRPEFDGDAVVAELVRREEESSTAIADGIAIPHARPKTGGPSAAGLGRAPRGIDFDSMDGRPTTLLMVLVSPVGGDGDHVAWLAHVARVLGDAATRRRILEAASERDVMDVIERRERELDDAAHGAIKDCR